MSLLAQQTITDLQSGDPAAVRDAILTAAAFFELASGHPQPADPAVLSAPASDDERAALRRALIGVVGAAADANAEAAALWALGKLDDRALIPFFVRWLVEHRARNPFAAHQALIGLNNHGESSLSLGEGLSSNAPELTLRQADAYLHEIGAI